MKNMEMEKSRKEIKKAIIKLLKNQVSYERVAELLLMRLENPLRLEIPKKSFVPFIFEYEIGKDKIIISVPHCMTNGQKASEWIKEKIWGCFNE